MALLEPQPDENRHYLEQEFLDLIHEDSLLLDFFGNGCLDGIWYWDLENPEHEWMNAGFWRTLGYDPTEMPNLASAWQHIIFPEDLDLAVENFQRHCADPGHPYDQIVRYRHKTGSTVWVRCRGLAIRDASGKPRRMLGVHTDVTELKQKELELARLNRELEEQRRHYHDLYVKTPAIMHSIDSNGCIVEVSNSWLKGLGYERGEVIGRRSTEFLSEESRKSVAEVALPEFWQSGVTNDLPLQFVRKDGRVLEMELSAVLERHGISGALQSLSVLTDVTERNAAFREIQAKNRTLEEINHDLEQFVRVASHDLQAPLRTISSFGSILKEDHQSQLDEDGQDYIDIMVKAADRMAHLVRSLLNYSRLRSRGAPERKRVDLSQLVAELKLDMTAVMNETDAAIRVGPLPDLYGDPILVDQLFRNLISNAIKYRHPDRAPIIDIACSPSQDERAMVCVVSDNGRGFDQQYAPKIFDAFTRLHAETIADGSGIGLAICKTACDRHGWTIAANGRVDCGASFTITIPSADIAEDSRPACVS